MSPFYLKEGEKKRERWGGEPKDLRGKNGEASGVSIFSVKDPERIRVLVSPDAKEYVLGERGTVIFPGQSATLNRDGFSIVDAKTRKTVAKVTHREKPIGKK